LVPFAPKYLILETKGYDPLAEIKEQAARRWTAAVNAHGRHGRWDFQMVRRVGEVRAAIDAASAAVIV
jgi:type III restriction enzyme